MLSARMFSPGRICRVFPGDLRAEHNASVWRGEVMRLQEPPGQLLQSLTGSGSRPTREAPSPKTSALMLLRSQRPCFMSCSWFIDLLIYSQALTLDQPKKFTENNLSTIQRNLMKMDLTPMWRETQLRQPVCSPLRKSFHLKFSNGEFLSYQRPTGMRFLFLSGNVHLYYSLLAT